MDQGCGQRLSLPQTGIRNARSVNRPHTAKQHQAAESKEHHGQTTALLYVLVLATTMTGWIFASERGWSISLYSAVPLPMLPTEGSLLANAIGKWHGTMEWALLLVIGAHVAAAMAHKRSGLNNRPSARFPFSRHYLSHGARHSQMPFARVPDAT
jgi:hypothetical protein